MTKVAANKEIVINVYNLELHIFRMAAIFFC